MTADRAQDIAARIQSEAAQAARNGQYQRLVDIADEVADLLDELEDLLAMRARVEALHENWRSLPVWGPDERGLMILDYVDHESIMRDLDNALDGPGRDLPASQGSGGAEGR